MLASNGCHADFKDKCTVATAFQLTCVLMCEKDFKASLCFLAHFFKPTLHEKQLELISRTEIIILDCICTEQDGEGSLCSC